MGADFAWLERSDEDAVGSPAQQLRQSVLALEPEQPSQVLSGQRQAVEGVELCPVVALAGVQGVEVRNPVDSEYDALAVNDELGLPFFLALSMIQGKRQVRSSPDLEWRRTSLQSRSRRAR